MRNAIRLPESTHVNDTERRIIVEIINQIPRSLQEGAISQSNADSSAIPKESLDVSIGITV